MIKIRAINKEDARPIILERDEYLDRLSLHNIKKITKNKIQDKEEFILNLPNNCIDWDEDLIKKIQNIEANINFKINELDFHFELLVNIVRTNGKDSFDLPYTRGNTIYMPKNENKKQQLGHLNTHLMVHEIFHIISRKYPQIREVLYPLMGFKKLKSEFDVMESIPAYVINPDALDYKYYIRVIYNYKGYKSFPIIFFKKNKFKWQYLVLLDEDENFFKLVPRSKTTFDYLNYNTTYLSHPEEICAENFRKWVMQDKDLNNPRLLEAFGVKMKELFN